jgi:hypothetical protein
MHGEVLATMERAFQRKEIFVIGYSKQLSIQTPPDPFEG